MKLKDACSLEKSNDKSRQRIKKQRHYFAYKGPQSQSYDFSSSHAWMREMDNKKGWTSKNWCLRTVVVEKTFENPLDSKEIKPVNPKGNQPWIFTKRTDDEAEILTLWPPDAKSQLGKDWRQEKGTTEDEMVARHDQLNRHECAQTPGDGERQGNLACCSPWGRKELDTTERLNNN